MILSIFLERETVDWERLHHGPASFNEQKQASCKPVSMNKNTSISVKSLSSAFVLQCAPGKAWEGAKVYWVGTIDVWADPSEVFKNVGQKEQVRAEIEVVILTYVFQVKKFPNFLIPFTVFF